LKKSINQNNTLLLIHYYFLSVSHFVFCSFVCQNSLVHFTPRVLALRSSLTLQIYITLSLSILWPTIPLHVYNVSADITNARKGLFGLGHYLSFPSGQLSDLTSTLLIKNVHLWEFIVWDALYIWYYILKFLDAYVFCGY
jgi:hypothetical protein